MFFSSSFYLNRLNIVLWMASSLFFHLLLTFGEETSDALAEGAAWTVSRLSGMGLWRISAFLSGWRAHGVMMILGRLLTTVELAVNHVVDRVE